jgi:hypothetical protein
MHDLDRQLGKAIVNLFKAARYLESPQFQIDLARQQEEDERNRQAALAKQNADFEFREEVIDAMEEAGISRRVAANMTATEATLMQNARKYGVI